MDKFSAKKYYTQFEGDLDEKAYNSDIFVQKFWQRMKISTVLRCIDSGNLILDLGSGSGVVSQLASRENDVVSCDISLKCIKNCLKLSPLSGGVVGDGLKLPFKNESFDAVLCIELIEHLIDPNQCIKEIYRILKREGILIISTPNFLSMWPIIEYMWDKFGRGRDYRTQHISPFNVKTITKLMQGNNLQIESKNTIFLSTPFTAILSKTLTDLVHPIDNIILRHLDVGMLIVLKCRKLS